MTANVSLLNGIIPEFLINGVPASGAQLFCYEAGTTTKQATYTDSSGGTEQTNPIILNARGEPENSMGNSIGIWPLSATPYKFVLAPSTDTDPPTNPIWTLDNVVAGVQTGVSYSASGINAITLTPLTGTPTITAYANYQEFNFVIPANTTGAVTMRVGTLGFLPLYTNGSQGGAGSFVAGQLVKAVYVSTVGAGGGFIAIPTNQLGGINTGTDTGSANAYVINPNPALTAYAANQVFVFEPANTNTGASTLNANSLGGKSIVTRGGLALVAGQMVAGVVALLVYDGTNLELLNPQLYPLPSSFANLKCSVASSGGSSATYTADEIVVKDSSGNATLLTSFSASAALTSSGAGGLDTGSVAASTGYFVWAIYNPSTATAALMFSLSATSPTLPSGYTQYARVGAFFTDSSSHIMPFIQYGGLVQCVNTGSGLPKMATGTAGSVSTPTYVSVAVTGFVPSTAAKIFFLFTQSNGAVLVAPNGSYGAEHSTTNPAMYDTAPSGIGSPQITARGEMLLESTSIYWASSGSSNSLWCAGWEDNL